MADTPVESLAAASIKEKVEDEKCVVAQYRTTTKQKNAFAQHLATCNKNSVPIEWVIDIADESNGWFYGTGYHYDDTTQMLHVMVPDKENPTFDGQVLLDHRTVHLIECVDGKSDALFNKIVRDSVIKVKWDVEWFEEAEDGQGEYKAGLETAPLKVKWDVEWFEEAEDGQGESQGWAGDGTTGSWIHSSARYYIRIANQLLVEDKDLGQESRGFVIITADLNLKLLKCHKGKGIDDFSRLINEGVVQSSPEAAEVARTTLSPQSTPVHANSGFRSNGDSASRPFSSAKDNYSAEDTTSPAANNTVLTPATKLADMSTGLRECVVDILDDRDRMKSEANQLADSFHAFALEGDLDEGLKLMQHFESVRAKAEKARAAQDSDLIVPDDADDKIEAIADDAIYLAQKLERNLTKIVRAGGEVSTSAEEEIESLRRSLRKARSDLQAKEDELREARG
eukprot:CAMPEP_0185015064 /NCGR_PEP_ID=MMETSP1098-20130426/99629_1 /TAXON_ID=89044 /ORGANISM="Spumella elongata, Strain CCAP 955/1" /LENGTH=453 /DNA_ID=CAMNT_0027544177 /DNA_START=147 /DNA_END=1509 /DNA_ORIENTATION=-